jgi:catalase-peroxidase
MTDDIEFPVTGIANKQVTGRGMSNRDWWPNQLKIEILH